MMIENLHKFVPRLLTEGRKINSVLRSVLNCPEQSAGLYCFLQPPAS